MFIFPNKPKVINKKDNWASFEIEGLYPGYGVTIGNSLRRVLLSSLEGAAITQIKIKGFQHEFSTIPGVLEDVLIVITNLKQLRFKMYSSEPQRSTLKIKGEKEVKGSDFKFPTQVELINKNCYIASLTDKKAELEMEIQIEKGIGYEPSDRRKNNQKLELGVVPIDAIFSPVKRVSFNVANMRVGERTDFDRLTLEIETDNTLEPEEAFFKACEILVKHFSLLAEPFAEKVSQPAEKSKEAEKKIKPKTKKVSKKSKK
jgi:DNA-directed RNA polymerase subunit alpha